MLSVRLKEFKEQTSERNTQHSGKFVCLISLNAFAQTADELVAKNLQAKGGVDKIKAIRSVRMTGNFDAGGFKATVGELSKRPDMVKETFHLAGHDPGAGV